MWKVAGFMGAGLLSTLSACGAQLGLNDRPQTPKERPYVIEKVAFPGGSENVQLAGELTLPDGKGPFPAAIMLTGSGPQNRDEELVGHKPFLVISDHLTRHGIAVLRYDDRGVAKSTGDYAKATHYDFAEDAKAALAFLQNDPRIARQSIGMIGHSEGGVVAPLAAGSSGVAFIVSLAGPALPIMPDVMRMQVTDVLKANGSDEKNIQLGIKLIDQTAHILTTAETAETARQTIFDTFREAGTSRREARANADLWGTPWGMAYAGYDPLGSFRAFQGPVLALFAEHDVQVDAESNAAALEHHLRHSKSQIVTLEGLNHLFQPATTGSPDEYGWISTTFDQKALNVMSDWITNL